MPESFVPLAEESGLIGELGRWVLRKACHQGALWRAKYPGHPGLGIGVNVSGAQLREPGLVQEVSDAYTYALLEALAGAVADELLRRFGVERAVVRVAKPDVRPGGLEGTPAVTVSRP